MERAMRGQSARRLEGASVSCEYKYAPWLFKMQSTRADRALLGYLGPTFYSSMGVSLKEFCKAKVTDLGRHGRPLDDDAGRVESVHMSMDHVPSLRDGRLERINRLSLAFCSSALLVWFGNCLSTVEDNNEHGSLATVVLRRRLGTMGAHLRQKGEPRSQRYHSRWLRCSFHFGLEANAAQTRWWLKKRYIKYALFRLPFPPQPSPLLASTS